MNNKTKKMNIIQYSKSMDKNLRILNKNKNLKEILQDMNNINNNILRYKQIENLLHYTTAKNKDFEKKNDENVENKGALLEDIKLLQNRLYKTKKLSNQETNIKVRRNSFKDVMKDIFGKSEVRQIRRYFPKPKAKLYQLNNLNTENMNFSERLFQKGRQSKKNICITERNINNYVEKKKNETKNNTIEGEKNTNINFGNYASNCVKYKHPQFYLLNANKINKKHLPPLKVNKIKLVDLLHKNNSYLKDIEKKNKYEKYMMAMQMAQIIKFKLK